MPEIYLVMLVSKSSHITIKKEKFVTFFSLQQSVINSTTTQRFHKSIAKDRDWYKKKKNKQTNEQTNAMRRNMWT